jgi:hypothetical protein
MLDNGLAGISNSAWSFVTGDKGLHYNPLGSSHADGSNTTLARRWITTINTATSRPTTTTTKELCMNKLASKGCPYRAAITFETGWQAGLRLGPRACEALAQALLKRENRL